MIRAMKEADYSLLEDFLYNAIYIPDGEELPLRDVVFDPNVYVYIDGFGSKDGDLGVVAEVKNNEVVGMAWTRIIPAYGHLDKDTPELAISVLPNYRGCGIGTMLMERLFKILKDAGYKRTSLSVQQNNPAVMFYKRLGYVVTDEKVDHEGNEDFVMVKKL